MGSGKSWVDLEVELDAEENSCESGVVGLLCSESRTWGCSSMAPLSWAFVVDMMVN